MCSTRSHLPCLIAGLMNNDPGIIAQSPAQLYNADILQFAGLSFLFFALAVKAKSKPLDVAAAAVAVSVTGIILSIMIPEVKNSVLQAVTGLFWGTHEGSYFPLASWILYPAAGYIFATFLKRTKDRNRFYLKVSLPSFFICPALTFILLRFYTWDSMMDGEVFYHQKLFMNLAYIAFILAWLGICFMIGKIIPDFLMNVLTKCSRNITPIYVAQYVLIVYVKAFVVGDAVFNVPVTLLFFAAYTAAAYFAADLYKTLRAKCAKPAVQDRSHQAA